MKTSLCLVLMNLKLIIDNGPYLLQTLTRCEQVALDVIPNDGEGVTVHEPEVREENSNE